MAPEIILEHLSSLPRGALILDPMCGSGTVLRASVEAGLDCVGFDLDPLAVLMSTVWTRSLPESFEDEADAVLVRAGNSHPTMPTSHSQCSETLTYCRFWFEDRQYDDLARLSAAMASADQACQAALRLCLSRIIITKENGASVARDTSHSRPHRVFFGNKFDVFRGFRLAAHGLRNKLKADEIIGSAVIKRGDARLTTLLDSSVDALVTSPPYLNAIDYMRGHRLALVWLGYTVPELRKLRSDAIGSEAGGAQTAIGEDVILPPSQLSGKHHAMVRRYISDMRQTMAEVRRVVKPGGRVLLVVGNSTLQNVVVSNADISVEAAEAVGMRLSKRHERDLPLRSRYLPISNGSNALDRRMRTETLLTFQC